ncbi:hypothetical protein LXA43DRAFT_1031005 [Ganoderma leucocontextum]|nr:hypothetical protein LXA43DRAFT_1031005 [Ganoderma leucocontextum]
MNPQSILERHPDLYFADGDVVLAVKQTPKSDDSHERPKYHLFRVYKFLLKHYLTTFANFFADANAAPTEVYDGVPLAQMHGDKAEDFALLLSYLYNPSSLVFRRRDPNTPRTVSGVIRLADKYLIEPLHRRLVQQVCEDWPTALTDYDVNEAEIDALKDLPSKAADGLYPISYLTDAIPEPISAIQFAQEFGCPQILRAAFYRLSLTPVTDYYLLRWPPEPLARLSALDKENLLRYIHGCQMLSKYDPSVTAFMCDECGEPWNVEDPPVDSPCYRYIERVFEVTRDKSPSPTHGDPLRWLAKCFDSYKMPELSKEHFPRGLCEECEQSFSCHLVTERQWIWDSLAKWFNLQ